MRQLFQNDIFFGAFFFGMGLIGMLDGIFFHQLLQWHSMYMYTSRFYQIVSDGWLHLFCTLLWVIGTLVLWNANPASEPQNKRIFLSGFLFGAGFFNFIEGIFDHHILQIHHVRFGSPNELLYDIIFDVVAVLLLVAGWWVRPHKRQIA